MVQLNTELAWIWQELWFPFSIEVKLTWKGLKLHNWSLELIMIKWPTLSSEETISKKLFEVFGSQIVGLLS